MKPTLNKAEVNILRSQTRGCADLIHFNNAGASLPPDIVVDTVIDYLKEEALRGGYETEARYSVQINEVYNSIARLINADEDEIAIFENASAAWVTAFRGLSFESGDEIITSEMEYVTNLIGLVDSQKAHGIVIKVVPNDLQGNLSLEKLEEAITSKTRLIAITHISSSSANVLPVEKIGEIAERHRILYLVDACQSAGQLPLDIKKIKCDMLSVTGRKYLRGPRGTGFLFVKKESQDRLKPVFLDSFAAADVSLSGYSLRKDARRFELYEKNRALVLGLGKAAEYAYNIGMDRIWDRIKHLSALARKELEKIDEVVIRDSGDQLCGLIVFSVKGMESSVVKLKLGVLGINVSVGASQATPLYMARQGLTSVVRASLHYYNTEEEIKTLSRELETIVKQEGKNAF